MTDGEPLDDAEAAYLAARSARDRFDVDLARGVPASAADVEELRAAADRAIADARAALGRVVEDQLGAADRAALDAMREGLDAAESYALPGVDDAGPNSAAA